MDETKGKHSSFVTRIKEHIYIAKAWNIYRKCQLFVYAEPAVVLYLNTERQNVSCKTLTQREK